MNTFLNQNIKVVTRKEKKNTRYEILLAKMNKCLHKNK